MSRNLKLQEKQDAKSRLLRKFRADARQRWTELCEREPRLPALRRAIRRCHNPAALLLGLSDSWVRSADAELRHAALRLVDRHANRMARFAGRQALDDPLPPATNVFFTAKQLLEVR